MNVAPGWDHRTGGQWWGVGAGGVGRTDETPTGLQFRVWHQHSFLSLTEVICCKNVNIKGGGMMGFMGTLCFSQLFYISKITPKSTLVYLFIFKDLIFK